MSHLLLKPHDPDQQGRIHCVSPESAGWKYVGLEVYRLKKRGPAEKKNRHP